MSEQQKPLSRRERRLREMAETGALELDQEALAAGAGDGAAAGTGEPTAAQLAEMQLREQLSAGIEIDPLGADGTPRTRRELRQLREQALEEALAAYYAEHGKPGERQTAAEQAEQQEPVSGSKHGVREEAATPEPAAAEQPEHAAEQLQQTAAAEAAQTAAEPEPAPAAATVDPDHDFPPTVQFSVDELRAAEEERVAEPVPGEAEVRADASIIDGLLEEVVETEAASETAAATAAPDPGAVAELFGETSVAAAPGAAAAAEEASGKEDRAAQKAARKAQRQAEKAARKQAKLEAKQRAAEQAAQAEEIVSAEAAAEAAAADAEQASEEQQAATSAAQPQETPAAVDAPETEQMPAPVSAKTEYSFPEIPPLTEPESVFDADSAVLQPRKSSSPQGFEELLERAVAQEGPASGINTSAIILPEAPDAGALTTPLNETGELFITGSLQLPKDLAETGGHARLHDTLQDLEIGAQAEEPQQIFETSEGPVPVPAKSAVSAKSAHSLEAVAATQKVGGRKLPLALGIAGGSLVVVVAGVVVVVLGMIGR